MDYKVILVELDLLLMECESPTRASYRLRPRLVNSAQNDWVNEAATYQEFLWDGTERIRRHRVSS